MLQNHRYTWRKLWQANAWQTTSDTKNSSHPNMDIICCRVCPFKRKTDPATPNERVPSSTYSQDKTYRPQDDPNRLMYYWRQASSIFGRLSTIFEDDEERKSRRSEFPDSRTNSKMSKTTLTNVISNDTKSTAVTTSQPETWNLHVLYSIANVANAW